MSWKSIVIAGLLCGLAAPSYAATVSAQLLGMDTAGNWVWEVSVDPLDSTFTDPVEVAPAVDRGPGGSVALEVGIEATGRGVVSAAPNTINSPSNNPGNGPAGWAVLAGSVSALHPNGVSDIDGDTVEDVGVRFNVASNRVIAFLGSQFFGDLNGATDGAGTWNAATNGDVKAAFRVHTERPTTAALTTTLNFSGAYTALGATGGALPVVAEANAQTGFTLGPLSKAVRSGNANLTAKVDVGDLAILAANFEVTPGPGGKRWNQADFTGDGHTNVGDLAVLAANFDQFDTNWTIAGVTNLPLTPGAGSGGGAGIASPEPSSLILVALGGLLAALSGRRRVA